PATNGGRSCIIDGALPLGRRLSRRLFQCPGLIQLVVERLETDAQLVGGLGLVAARSFEGVVDRLHFQLAKRHYAGLLPCGADELTRVEATRQVLAADRTAVAQDRGVL